MVNYDIATGREFMFQISMERLSLQLIKKNFLSLNRFHPLNYHKASNPTFLSTPLKFQKKLPSTNISYMKTGSNRKRGYWFLKRKLGDFRNLHWWLKKISCTDCLIFHYFLVTKKKNYLWKLYTTFLNLILVTVRFIKS